MLLRQKTKLFTYKSLLRLSQGFRCSVTDFYINGKVKREQYTQIYIFARQLKASRNIARKNINR